MEDHRIYELVFEALNNAKDNGYDARGEDVEDTISELLAYDADLENQTRDALRPHVEAWMEANPK